MMLDCKTTAFVCPSAQPLRVMVWVSSLAILFFLSLLIHSRQQRLQLCIIVYLVHHLQRSSKLSKM